MKSGRSLIAIGLTTLLLVTLLPSAGFAQSAPITAKVDRTRLSTDETLTLTVVVEGSGDLPSPSLPSLDMFDVVGRSTASQISIRNQKISSEVTYQYTLRPIRAGAVTIGSISISVDGKTFATDPIRIEVAQGSARPRLRLDPGLRLPSPRQLTGQDFFAEAEVDNSNPYFGQQIVYVFRFYYASIVVGRPSYEAPAFAGFWSRPETEQVQYDATMANRRYRVLELRTVLFPTITGSIMIEPASLSVPGRIFQTSTGLVTAPVDLEVRPLPSGAPKEFKGAVGQFEIRAELGSISGKSNEPVTMRVILSGKGNIDALPDPEWPEMPSWRAFDSGATINSGVADDRLTGSRIYERLMIPSIAGNFTIPPVTYVYFDPESSTYRTIATDPISISIEPGPQRAPADPPSAAAQTAPRVADFRHIKPVPAELRKANISLTDQIGYWIAWGVPMLLLIAAGVWQRNKQKYEGDAALARRVQAYVNARSLLMQAKRDHLDPYDAAGRALASYIGDKLDEPVTGMTREALTGLLATRGVDLQVIERVTGCLIVSDGGRFAPTGGGLDSGRSLLDETEILISDLERELGA